MFNINVFYMQVILNFTAFFLIYFFIQIILYRYFKININKLFIVLFIIGISIIVGFYSYSIELLMNLININLMVICFWLFMPGVINHGPALEIIHLIANKKINNQKKLRKFFLKSKVSRAVEKRLNINISSNLIKFDKEGLFITKNTKKMLIFFDLIKKIYRLKSDAY